MDDMAERKGADMTEEYISRKAVRDAIASLSIERFELSNAYRLYVEALDNVDKKVVKIPAADVEPVRHGRWKEESDYDGDSIYVCSECGETWTLIDGTPQDNNMRYCPHCGARMDGGKNV